MGTFHVFERPGAGGPSRTAGFRHQRLVNLDSGILRNDRGPLDNVFELPYVARPRIAHQIIRCCVRHPRQRLAELLGQLSQQMIDQQWNIRASLAQRRHLQGKNVQPVKQIHAELVGLHLRWEIAVGGGNDSHVHSDRLAAADPLEFLLL